MTVDPSAGSQGFADRASDDAPSHVTVTRVTDEVEVVEVTEVVESVSPDGEVERDVIAVEHIEREVLEVESVEVEVEMDVEVESVDALLSDLGADEERVATQGALPLDVRTGDAGVDAAVAQLRDLDDRPVAEHAEVFTAVHRALQDALVDLDRS
jgi:hypothetical protein